MNDYDNARFNNYGVGATANMAVDQGLRSFMLGVYNKMGLGLIWSGILALITSSPAVAPYIFGTPIGMVLAFAPVIVLFGAGFLMKNPSPRSAGALYWGVVTLIGAGLGYLFIAYTKHSIALTFFVTASAFGALSLFGYTTKKDLTGFGSFLIMAVWGLLIASIVNIFLKNSMFDLVISGIGVLIFSGLIAFNTQNLKYQYYQLAGDGNALGVATNFGALGLYIDFINLFQFLLRFLGDSRN